MRSRNTETAYVTAFCLVTLCSSSANAQISINDVIQNNNDGVKALNAKNFPLAIELFKRTLSMNPDYKLAKENLAITFNQYGESKKDNPKEALQWYHKAMAMNPSSYTLINNLESTIKKLGKDPKAFFDRIELAETSKANCEFDGAIVEYEEALKLKDDAKTHEALADVLLLVDEEDKAVSEYEKANKLSHSSVLDQKIPKAKQTHRFAYGATKKPQIVDLAALEKTQSEWEDKLKRDPLSPANHVGLGRALDMRRDVGGALAEYKQALQLGKNLPEEEKAKIQRRIDNLPGQKQSREMHDAIALFAAAKYDQAIESFQRIIAASHEEQNSRKADAYVYIGRSLIAKGQLDKSKVFLEKAWKEDCDFWGLNQAHIEFVAAAMKQNNRIITRPQQNNDTAPSIDDIYKRVAALENKVFEKTNEQANIEVRIDKLETQLAIRKESSSVVKRLSALEKKLQTEPAVPYEQISQFNKALSRLEEIHFGKASDAEDIQQRMERLEVKLTGKKRLGSMMSRLDSLLILDSSNK